VPVQPLPVSRGVSQRSAAGDSTPVTVIPGVAPRIITSLTGASDHAGTHRPTRPGEAWP
jgi:hypothetical protein